MKDQVVIKYAVRLDGGDVYPIMFRPSGDFTYDGENIEDLIKSLGQKGYTLVNSYREALDMTGELGDE